MHSPASNSPVHAEVLMRRILLVHVMTVSTAVVAATGEAQVGNAASGNPESERAAREALEAFITSWNTADDAELRGAMHFPFVTFGPGAVLAIAPEPVDGHAGRARMTENRTGQTVKRRASSPVRGRRHAVWDEPTADSSHAAPDPKLSRPARNNQPHSAWPLHLVARGHGARTLGYRPNINRGATMQRRPSHRHAASVPVRFHMFRTTVLTSAAVGGLAVALAAGTIPVGAPEDVGLSSERLQRINQRRRARHR